MSLVQLKERAKRLLPQNRFARSVSVLAGGTAGGQIIVIAASPILTRLYTPEGFGLLAVYAGILGIVGVIASLRYQLAIPLSESDLESSNIAVLSLLIIVVITLLTTVAIWLLGDQLVNLLNTPNLLHYLWLLPIGLFFTGVYQVFEYWALRDKCFANIARTRLAQSLAMVVIQIGGSTFGPIALVLGRVVGLSVGAWGLAKSALKENSAEIRLVSSEGVRKAASEYRKFPLVSTWVGLASSASMNLTPLLIASFLGAGAAGFFSLAHRVLSQPMAVIGKAVSDAFYQKAAENNRAGQLDKLVESVYSVLVKLALAPAITIFLVIPNMFVFIFGEKWGVGGDIARWMTPWLFFQFVISPCTGIYPIINRHDIALRFQLSLLASSILGAVIGGLYFKDQILTVALISCFSSFVYLWRAATTFKVVGLDGIKAVFLLGEATPFAIVVNLPVILIGTFWSSNAILVALGVLTNAILWFVIIARPILLSKSNLSIGS